MRSAKASAIVSAAILAVISTACGTTPENDPIAGPSQSRQATGGVYRAVITLAGMPDGDQRVEWLDPQSGAWRAEEADETRIFTGSSYAVIDQWGARIRSGSPAFLGRRPNLSLAMEPLRSYLAGTSEERNVKVSQVAPDKVELRFSRSGYSLVANVELAPLAAQADLFAVPSDEVIVHERELAVGESPNVPVRPYWLGQAVNVGVARTATTVVEYHSVATPAMLESGGWSAQDSGDAYIVFYEDSTADGRTSATSDAVLEHELQVVSQAITSAAAQQDLASFDGVVGDLPGPVWLRKTINLGNGERATLFIDAWEDLGREGISFAIATPSTLVHVSGDVKPKEIATLAGELTPVAP